MHRLRQRRPTWRQPPWHRLHSHLHGMQQLIISESPDMMYIAMAPRINSSSISGTSYAVTGLTASTTCSIHGKSKRCSKQWVCIQPAAKVSPHSPRIPAQSLSRNGQWLAINACRTTCIWAWQQSGNTERFAGRVNFVVPATGAKTTVLTLGSKMVNAGGQDGLMGLALHPDFNNGKPYVYISYTYQSVSSTVRKTRIERYTYNSSTKTLGSPAHYFGRHTG